MEPLFRYQATSHAFLARGKEALAQSDSEGSVDSFFAAAMFLRFGIEARLFEYLDATFRALGTAPRPSAEYVASKLLKRLVEADPRAAFDGGVRLTSEKTGQATSLHFTPVTKELATLHGKLGGLLHFSFFRQNPDWPLRVNSRNPPRTLLDYRDLLVRTVDELTRATSGRLLSHPRFAEIVSDIVDECEDDIAP